MKVRCKTEVQDKYTGEWYRVNNVYELTKERAEEVVKAYDGRYFEFAEEQIVEAGEVIVPVEKIKEAIDKVVEEKPKRVRKSTKK